MWHRNEFVGKKAHHETHVPAWQDWPTVERRLGNVLKEGNLLEHSAGCPEGP